MKSRHVNPLLLRIEKSPQFVAQNVKLVLLLSLGTDRYESPPPDFKLLARCLRSLIVVLVMVLPAVSAVAQVGGGGSTSLNSLQDFVRHEVDYQGNMQTSDAKFSPGLAPSIEWQEGLPSVDYIVYKMGDTIHGVTKFKNYNWFGIYVTGVEVHGSPKLVSPAANAVVSASGGTVTEEIRGLSYAITNVAPPYVGPGGTLSVSWTVSGVPNHLCAGRMSLPVKITGYDDEFGMPFANYEELAGVKLSRMVSTPVDTMATPWGDFAYHVGLWGWGATTQAQAHQNLVYGIHYSERHFDHILYYSYEDGSKYFIPEFNTTLGIYTSFAMTDLMNDLATIAVIPMDCHDFSGVLAYAIEANGMDAQCRGVETVTEFPQYPDIFTTDLCRAGLDSNNLINYTQKEFSRHVVVTLTNHSEVSDASMAYRWALSGILHVEPVYGWTTDSDWWQSWGSAITQQYVGFCVFPQPASRNMLLWNSDLLPSEIH